jgi:hypothetical protein
MRALISLLLLMLAAPVSAATERVGSVDEVAVIDRLDVADLPPGEVSRFWFRAGTSALRPSGLRFTRLGASACTSP